MRYDLSIRNGKPLRLCFGGFCDPLPTWDWVWVALGWPLGHPRATQASPKDHPSVDVRKRLCLQRKQENGGVGSKHNCQNRRNCANRKPKPLTIQRTPRNTKTRLWVTGLCHRVVAGEAPALHKTSGSTNLVAPPTKSEVWVKQV